MSAGVSALTAQRCVCIAFIHVNAYHLPHARHAPMPMPGDLHPS
jgi:hypothetical protein